MECSSSPGSPGEVRLHVMDQPPPPPPPIQSVTVQLRLSTGEHFPVSSSRGTHGHIEKHLLTPGGNSPPKFH